MEIRGDTRADLRTAKKARGKRCLMPRRRKREKREGKKKTRPRASPLLKDIPLACAYRGDTDAYLRRYLCRHVNISIHLQAEMAGVLFHALLPVSLHGGRRTCEQEKTCMHRASTLPLNRSQPSISLCCGRRSTRLSETLFFFLSLFFLPFFLLPVIQT